MINETPAEADAAADVDPANRAAANDPGMDQLARRPPLVLIEPADADAICTDELCLPPDVGR